ncbi:hypothetical protein GF359_07695 [candidate division WOR-3 bacterium]|uniref:O-antigen ligase-related domain-containing protein n=1 Tax=candidate division WOR-3 bacterium TaxID=2052148 RepID=A0A9D5QCZ3_UNCW3|nr:hypothetical protein [candidate division WOR-3 bacterium]MBD3365084.1 hypothetical protein [candidate division WOR-3 bacterium]
MARSLNSIERFSKEPMWVALAFLITLASGVPFIFLVPGLTGIVVAASPLLVLFVILIVVNPYPFWLGYFFLVPIMLILQDIFPLESFTRFFGLFMVALSVPNILLSKRTPYFKVTAVGASLLIFFAGCCFSLLGTWFIEKAFVGLGLFFGNLLLYWICVNLFAPEKRLRTVLDVFIIGMVVQSIISIFIKFVGHPLLRAQGTITDPNYFGFWLLPILTISFYSGFSAERRWQKALFFLAFLLMSLALPLTYSRSMLIIFVPLQVFLFTRFKRPHLGVGLLIVGIIIFYFAFQQYFATSGLSLMNFFTATRIGSIQWRAHFAVKSIEIFLNHPLFGIGVDCFRSIFRFYSSTTPHVFSPVIHNSYLEILSGTGLLGFIPFMTAIFFSLRNFWRARKSFIALNDRKRALFAEGLLVAFLAQLFTHIFLSTQHHILLFSFFAFSTIVMNHALDIKSRGMKDHLR